MKPVNGNDTVVRATFRNMIFRFRTGKVLTVNLEGGHSGFGLASPHPGFRLTIFIFNGLKLGRIALTGAYLSCKIFWLAQIINAIILDISFKSSSAIVYFSRFHIYLVTNWCPLEILYNCR